MRKIPSPPAKLISGHFGPFYKDELSFLYKTSLEFPVAANIRIFHFQAILFSHPEAVEHILQKAHTNYNKDVLDYQILKRVLGNGLLTSDGTFWLQQRRTAQPAFHRDRIKAYGSKMQEATDELVRSLHERRGETIPVDLIMMELTLKIVGEALFGQNLSTAAHDVGYYFGRANNLLVKRLKAGMPAWMITPSDIPLYLAARRLRSIVMSIIRKRKQNGEQAFDSGGDPNLLDRLLAARDPETGHPMSEKQLRDEVMTLMLAGHETTANALTWTLYLLALHRDVYEKLREEVQKASVEQILDGESLPYLNQVIEESMRLYPPAWIVSRRTVKEDEILGYRVPAGRPVFACQYVTHRHPDYWQSPEAFDPERFSSENRKRIHKFAYFPFGGGPRLCIGSGFAMLESRIILAELVRNFRFEHSGEPVELDPLITLRPRNGLRLRLI
ncbi:MAG: cytochrome P450 [Spirochaetaceae bacterium]|nr:cytochrome P450 [Spirochaetaceae bacterium]|tara:strand:- start:38786 stop:40117 length:1332 start_codon:yes stop_codon:yes gene_type:complete